MRSIILALALLSTTAAFAEPRIDAVQEKLPEQARNALNGIGEPDRKLLALRSYLRSAKSLEARWSWTQGEIDAYSKSDQYVSAMAAVAAVVKAFEVKNPGYTLHVNTEVRSLEEQLAKWNSNASVKAAATEIDAATTKWLADSPKAGPDELRNFLVGWKPATTASLAAPGLTAHGRGEAIDFQIAKGSAVIAGADTGAITSKWEAEGWGAKLQEAVRLSMMPFKGPLTDPNEPWHYDYNPPERSKLVVAAETPAATPVPTATRPWADGVIAGAVPVPTARPGGAASVKSVEVVKAKPVVKKKAAVKKKRKKARRR